MIVRQTKLLLLLLLTMLNVVNASATINGDKFTKDGMTYVITDVTHHEVAFAGSNNSGAISIPATVNDGVNPHPKQQQRAQCHVCGNSKHGHGYGGELSRWEQDDDSQRSCIGNKHGQWCIQCLPSSSGNQC